MLCVLPPTHNTTMHTHTLSRPLLSVDEVHAIRDHSLIEEYFDSIDQLLEIVRREAAAAAGGGELQADGPALELCNAISTLQEVRGRLGVGVCVFAIVWGGVCGRRVAGGGAGPGAVQCHLHAAGGEGQLSVCLILR